MKKVKVLSLFDGMACTRIALDKLGHKKVDYYAAEIDPYSMKVAKDNYPDIHHIGDVTKIDKKYIKSLGKVDLMIGGSPCQGFSNSGKGLNFDDPRSMLFFEYVRILKELKPKYFILENVNMKKEWADIISQYLGVEPILINSNLVSAQNRPRLYWTNIPNIQPPKDKKIFFQDIMEKKPAPNYYYSPAALDWIRRHGERKNKKIRELNKKDVKMQCLEASMFKNYSSQRFFQVTDKKGPRYITVIESERCQTVPDNYTKAVSNTQRYKMLGNGFTVDMIVHLLKNVLKA